MCESELIMNDYISDYETGNYIPLRLWDRGLPDNIEIEESSRGIKTGGEYRKVDMNNLICSESVIKKNWKFEWIPQELKLEDGFLWGKVPEGQSGVFHFSDNNKPFFTVCSRKVKLTDKVIQGLGLLEGEMIRSKEGKSGQYLSFSNMEPELVNLAVNALNEVGISLQRMRVQPIANVKEKVVDEQEVIDYWTSSTPFSKRHFVSIYRDSRYETEAKYGSVNLKVYDKIMRNLLESLIDRVKDSSGETQIREFLRGLFAAEGGVNLSPQNRINHISLGVKDPDLRREYREMFQKIGIEPGGNIDSVSREEAEEKGWRRGTGGYFMIQGTENFEKLLDYELLDLYPKKELLLLIGLDNRPSLDEVSEEKVTRRLKDLKSQYPEIYDKIQERIQSLTKRDREVLSLIEELEGADAPRIADELDINRSSASRRMRSLYQKDKVERNKQGRKIIWTPCQDQ